MIGGHSLPSMPERRRSSGEYPIVRRPPSGRTAVADMADVDDDVTPPPVSDEQFRESRRSRMTEVEMGLRVLHHRHDTLTRSVDGLHSSIQAVENRHDELGAAVAQIRSDNAVSAVKLDAIRDGVSRLESSRAKGGDRAWQIVALLIAAASSVVALISLATR